MNPDKIDLARGSKAHFSYMASIFELTFIRPWVGPYVVRRSNKYFIASRKHPLTMVFFVGQHKLSEALVAILLRNRVRTANIYGARSVESINGMGVVIAHRPKGKIVPKKGTSLSKEIYVLDELCHFMNSQISWASGQRNHQSSPGG
jgi:hypothetical protein